MSEQPQKIDASIYDKGSPEYKFKEYVRNLKLSPEDLNKKILDIGSGAGNFAKWASEHEGGKNIYSVDKYNAETSTPNIVRGEANKLPFKDGSFELVISNNSMPSLLYFEDKTQSKINPRYKHDPHKNMNEGLSEMLRVLKSEGEIRLAPVVHLEKTEEMLEKVKVFNEELDALKKEKKIDVEQISLGKSKSPEGEVEVFLYKIKKLK